MKFLAEAQVAVLVTALLLGVGTISTCAVVLGTTDDSQRPEWVNPALGLVPLAVALLAWSGALGVYIVACLLTRILQDATWIVSVRADVFLLSAFLVWGLIANICMTVAVGLSVNSRGMNATQSLAADQAGTAAAVFTWIIICILTIWLAVEITYIKMEYGRLAAVWSQSLRVLTPERVRRGGVNLAEPAEKNMRARQATTPPATYTIPQLPAKARPASQPVVRAEAEAVPNAVRERDAGDAAYEAERRARREQRRRRRERREERRAIRAVREMEEREAVEAIAAAEAEAAAAGAGAHDHRNGEHCPTCGSHSAYWDSAKAAPTSPLRAEIVARGATHHEGLSAMTSGAGPSGSGAGTGAGVGGAARAEAEAGVGAGSKSKRPDKGKQPATRPVSAPAPAPPAAGPAAGTGPSTKRKIGSGESPPLPPLPSESTASSISPVSPHIEPLVLPPIGFSLFSTETLDSPVRRPSPETSANAQASGSNSRAGGMPSDYPDYYNDRLSQPTLKSLKSLKSSTGESPISPELERKA